MKKLTFTLLFAIITIGLIAQDFEVPQNYKLDKVEDYALYEQDVINCVDWLMKTPLNKEASKRKDANAFLLKWMTGSPNVHLEIKQEIVTFISTSPDLFMLFMGGWTKYSLETKDFDDKVAGNMAGIKTVIDFYTKNKEFIKKDKNIEKYIKMKEKGKLKDFIKDNA
ncbi:MAG: hypothetical protein K8R54_11300 [Bacteroidales bacterium]|nr:hypothetical protein [Bacteroidales bacterium]